MSCVSQSNTPYAHPADRVLRPSEQEAIVSWHDLVEANAEQEARLRETQALEDYWAPGRRDHPIYHVNLDQIPPMLPAVRQLSQPDDVWIDIGAGVGKQALYLAQSVRRVLAWDPSPGMLVRLQENVDTFDADNVKVLPVDGWSLESLTNEPVDVCFNAHVTYFVDNIGGFLDAMETQARRLCVVLANERGTGWQPIEPLFEEVHGEKYVRLPAAPELLTVLGSRRRLVNVEMFPFGLPVARDLDDAHEHIRDDYWVEPGSEKDIRLRESIMKHFSIGNGQVLIPAPPGYYSTVMHWIPQVN